MDYLFTNCNNFREGLFAGCFEGHLGFILAFKKTPVGGIHIRFVSYIICTRFRIGDLMLSSLSIFNSYFSICLLV